MTAVPNSLREDLLDLTAGEVLSSDLERAAYATDASILEVRPLAVVVPKTAEEIADIVRYAAANGLTIHPRGAGTGLAGESLGSGIVLDTSRYFRRILATDDTWARVEPGVRWIDLKNALAATGRMFPPDPISGATCTIGGMLATDAAGPHSLRYGTSGDYVHRLKVVLADGQIVEIGREPRDPASHPENSPLRRIVGPIASLLESNEAAIRAEQPPTLLKHGGYPLRGILDADSIDLARLMVGSEGTLGIIVEAELATLPIPRHRGMMLASFASLESAAHAVVEALEYLPTACELLDRRLIALIRDIHSVYSRWIPADAEALLLFEQEGNSAENVRERILLMAHRLERVKRLATRTVQIYREPELSLCWDIRNRATPRMGHGPGGPRPTPFIENTAVPPARLPDFLKAVQDIMKRHGVTASYAAHAGVGILHTRPLLDLRRPDHRRTMVAVTEAVMEAVLAHEGTIAGEHGVGLLRSGLLPRQYPRLAPVFARIKDIWDPAGTLNPGRIAGAPPRLPLELLRQRELAGSPETAPTYAPQLLWNESPLLDSAEQCNGCAACQTTAPSARMCPSFHVEQSELAGPRSKANLLRQLLVGEVDPRQLPTGEFRAIADYCVHCKMCKHECPSGVDISKLMVEAKAANVAEEGLGTTDAFFSRLPGWSDWGSRNAFFVNGLLRNPWSRWAIERWFGLSRQRRLPRLHHRSFLRRAAVQGWTQLPRASDPRPKVAIFVDTYGNYFDPHLTECMIRVLEHHQRRVYVPPGQVGSGMAALALGELEAARSALNKNIAIFIELLRQGYDIVTAEPSAALMFRDEARHLVADPDLRLLEERTYECSEYLGVLQERGELHEGSNPLPFTVAYHEPCHQRALVPRANIPRLLGRLSGTRLVHLDHGCSGMAGTFGMRARGYVASLRAGAAMLERVAAEDIHLATAQCSACRLQIEQGSGKRSLHPVELFAVSLGLVADPARLLAPPRGSLLVS